MTENTLDVSNGHIDNLIKYVLDTKPYHVKLSEVVEEFLFEDSFAVKIIAESFESMAVLGMDYLKKSSNPALNIWQKASIRPESSLSAERALVSDGSRRVFAVPAVLANKFLTESSQELHIASGDPTEIPGLNTGVLSPRRFTGAGVPRVSVNGTKLTEGVNFHLSLGAFSFNAGAGVWQQHNLVGLPTSVDVNGDLSHEDVIRQFGRITDIVADYSVANYQEWTLTWNDGDQKLDVAGSVSGLIGQAEYGVEFTHSLISFLFTHAPDELDILPPIAEGDTFVLTPSAKITVHPDAASETWTLIKTNPQTVVGEPVFTGGAGPTPGLTIYSRGLEDTVATTFTITFADDESFSISSSTSLTGYPKTDLPIDQAFEDSFIHIKINRGGRTFAAAETFTFQVSADKHHYLVYGSTSGWSTPATIGEWYWNGKIGFKIPRLEYFIYLNDDVNSVFTQFFLPHHPPASWATPSKYDIVFHEPNSPSTTEVTASVFNNIFGYSDGLRCGQPWKDSCCSWTIDGTYSPGDKLTVLLAPSDMYTYFAGYDEAPYDSSLYDVGTSEVSFASNILQEYFPLYHSFGSVIIPSAQEDDVIVINKTERDHVRLRINKPAELQENGLGLNLGQSLGGVNVDPSQMVLDDTLGDAAGWVPLSFKYFNSNNEPCVYPDYAAKIEAYLAVSPATKVFEIRQPLQQIPVIEFDEDFFDDYLPAGTNFWLRFHQNSSYAQIVNVKVSEHLAIAMTRTEPEDPNNIVAPENWDTDESGLAPPNHFYGGSGATLAGIVGEITNPILDAWTGSEYDILNTAAGSGTLFKFPTPQTFSHLRIDHTNDYSSIAVVLWDAAGNRIDTSYISAIELEDLGGGRRVSTWALSWPVTASAFGLIGHMGYPQGIPNIIHGVYITPP